MTQPPNDSLSESLSALSDAEASELELRRVLKNVDEDQELRAKWRRYHIASSLIRQDGQIDLSVDLSSRIRSAIDGEDSYNSDNSSDNSDYLSEDNISQAQPLVDSMARGGETAVASKSKLKSFNDVFLKSSIAASVAIALVAGVQFTQTANTGGANVNEHSYIAGAEGVNESQGGPSVSEEQFAVAESVMPAQIQQGAVTTIPEGFFVPAPVSRNAANITDAPVYGAAKASNSALANEVARTVPARPTNAQLQSELELLMQQHAERSSHQGGLGLLPFARISRLPESQQAAE